MKLTHTQKEEQVLALRKAIVAMLDVTDIQLEANVSWQLIQPTLKMVSDYQKLIDVLCEE
jgi:hypothetical protein